MGLLNDLANQLERQIPAHLQTALQQALDDYRPACPDCRLAMPRRHRYAHTITTSYGAVRRQVPVFRCAPCRRPAFQEISGGMTLRGDDALDQSRPLSAILKKTRNRALTLAVRGLSYARAGQWVGCVKSAIGKWLRWTSAGPGFQETKGCRWNWMAHGRAPAPDARN